MEAVIFDLDGTIVLSHPTHFAAYEKLFSQFGIQWNMQEFEQVFVGTGAPVIIDQILRRSGVHVTAFDLDALVREKRDLFDELLNTERLKIVPGFFDFLASVNVRGLKKAIASGSNRNNINAMLKNIGASEEFHVLVSGEDVALPKPAPDIFLKAARLIRAAPEHCLVIEDTTHGVRAAKEAGMRCIALTTTMRAADLREAGADEVVGDYRGIKL